jgi:hypothetical protein
MKINFFFSLSRLSDGELVDRVKELVGRERGATADLIAHLAEFDTRKLYLPLGYSSLFVYCTRALQLSESSTYARIQAARAARKFAIILDQLADGSVNLTTVTLLAPHLTPENYAELLKAASGKTRREVEELVARIRPLPPASAFIRKLPARGFPDRADSSPSLFLEPPLFEDSGPAGPVSVNLDHRENSPAVSSAAVACPVASPRLASAAPARPAVIVPLSPDHYKLQVTLSAETHLMLRQARELLSHQIPDGDLAEILHRAMKLLVEKLRKQKFCETDRPRRRGLSNQGGSGKPPSTDDLRPSASAQISCIRLE